MQKKPTFFIILALFIALLAAVSSYVWRSGEKSKIKNINRTLARNVKAKGLPASVGTMATKKVSIKSAPKTSKTSLTEEKLKSLRRFHSQNRIPHTLTELPKERSIILANRTISVPENGEFPTSLSQNQIPTSRSTLPYIIHFGKPVTLEMRQRVQKSGAILRGYLPNYAFLAEVTSDSLQVLADNPDINYMTEYTVDDKIQPFLAALTKTENAEETIQVSIQTLDGKDVTQVVSYLNRSGGSVESVKQLSEWGVVDAVVALNDMATLAKMGEVQWIEERIEAKMLNDSATEAEHLNAVSMWDSWHLTGRGQVVGHADTGVDTGDETSIHEDFKGQIKALYDRSNGGDDAADYDGHGTHTAGSICGSGASSGGQYRGIAHGAQLVSQCVADKNSGSLTGISDLFGLYQQSYDAGASIHSDSWGADSYGVYDTMSRITDLFAWTNKDFLPVFSAGNSGDDSNDDGVVDLDSIGSPASAKNVLTVGATENDRTVIPEGYRGRTYGNTWPGSYGTNPIKDDWISWSATPSPYLQGMAAYSSRGPTDDQRIKPEVCAPGTDVISTRSSISGSSYGWGILPSNDKYCYNGGTSMSTPLTAGAVSLIRQYMVERAGIAQPSSALMKAAMVGGSRTLAPGQYGTGTTQEIPFSSPNNVEGWGQPDLEQAVHPSGLMVKLVDEISAETGETNIFEITVEKSGYPLDIVLCWVDYPATAGAAATLINNINLNVVTPGTNTLFPNNGIINDSVNTVESIAISSATSGVYTVKVIGENVPQSGGTAALYIRGAFDETPIIVHEAETYYNSELAPYPINFKVQSLNILTNHELTVFYNTGTGNSVTGEWHTATTEWTGNANYQALIPLYPENTILHYYIKLTNELYNVELPQSAVASNSYFVMNLRAPVPLIVEGNPDNYGTVSPDYGTNTLLEGVEYTASASTERVSSTEQLAMYDWNGSGDIPASGNENPFTIMISQESSLTWNWQTQYLLTRKRYFKNLNATTSNGSEWYWKDMIVPDQEEANLLNVTYGYFYQELYAFYGWSLDGSRWPDETSPSINPLAGLVMTNAFSLQANYMEFNTDEDGDLLYDWWEMSHYGGTNGTDSLSDDTDDDLWTNLGESLDNTNPHDPASVPTPPVIMVNPLDPFQSEHPPWGVTAEVTDNFMLMGVILEWKEKGDTEWQQIDMEYQDGNTFAGVLDPASRGAKRVDYRVTAYDLVGYYDPSFAAVSPIYSVIGDYEHPWMDFSPLSLGLAELTDQPTNYTLNVSNLAGPDLVWTGVICSAALVFDVDDPDWSHSGTNDAWNITTNRTWNEEPVWYCGDTNTYLYPNLCHAPLDTPLFTVGSNGTLVFRQWMDFEDYLSYDEGCYWDGAVVMISTNNGASFVTIEPQGGYNGYIYPNDDSPFPYNMPCYGDTGSGWQTAVFDLSEFEGQNCRVRFEFGSDRYTVDEGWYIAGVTVLSSDVPQPAWLTRTGSWNGILPDMWSNQFGFTVDPQLIETNSEHTLCIRAESNDPESNPIAQLTIRRGFAVTGETSGFGSITINDPFIFRNEESVVEIQADYGSYLTNVTINGVLQPGDYAYKDTYRIYTTQPVTSNLHFVADFTLRSWDLTVNSTYGNPNPAVGYHYITHGTVIDASVATPVTDANPMIRYSADNFLLEGVDPVSTGMGEISFVLTNHTTLTWNWNTNYQLNAVSTGNGIVMPSEAWYIAGSTGSTTGYPSPYYHFTEWSGDTAGANIDGSIISFTMNEPKSVTASFEVNLTPSHGVPETWLASYGFRGDMEEAAEDDQDGDRMETWKEWRSDTDPTDINSLLRIESIAVNGSSIGIQWIGGIMRTQVLQYASSPYGPWVNTEYTNNPPTAVTNNIGWLWLPDDMPSNRFFRVVVP